MHKRNTFVTFSLSILLLLLTACAQNTIPTEDARKDDFRTVSTGSTENGDVLIDLTPKEVINNKLIVNIGVNTHSIDLDQFDLVKITTLEFEGKTFNPVIAPKLSGHHSSGNLEFDVQDRISKFTIKIKGVPKVEERIFEWRQE